MDLILLLEEKQDVLHNGDRQASGRTNRWMDGQTEKQADVQTDWHADRYGQSTRNCGEYPQF